MESVKGFLEELDSHWSLPSNVVIGGGNNKFKSPVQLAVENLRFLRNTIVRHSLATEFNMDCGAQDFGNHLVDGSYALWHYFHLVEFIRPYIGE